MRIVRNRSIPNVDTERLVSDLSILHQNMHTVEGLREFDDSRRSLYNFGIKIKLISTELAKRGESHNGCVYCAPYPEERS